MTTEIRCVGRYSRQCELTIGHDGPHLFIPSKSESRAIRVVDAAREVCKTITLVALVDQGRTEAFDKLLQALAEFDKEKPDAK